MARYKPKTTTSKLVAQKTDIGKSLDAPGRWAIFWLPKDKQVLPGIALDDAGAVVEQIDFKLRREATEAYDTLLQAIDTLDAQTTANLPLEDSIRLGLEAIADVHRQLTDEIVPA